MKNPTNLKSFYSGYFFNHGQFRYKICQLIWIIKKVSNIDLFCRLVLWSNIKKSSKYDACWWSKNGLKHGPYKEWWITGEIKEECFYKNGELDGLYRMWFKSGQLLNECNYKNGQLHGIYKIWTNNGDIYKEYKYKNGKKLYSVGHWIN